MNIKMKEIIETNFAIGQVVRHKFLDFRGVIFDVDPEFNNTEEWYQSIPAQIRPKKISLFIMYLPRMTKSSIQLTFLNKIY